MNPPVLYRRRLIPDECILLKSDTVLFCDEKILITKWDTIRPKADIKRGVSAYLWDEGFKLSRFYGHQDQFLYWYCDIISHDYVPGAGTCTVTDLLADVLIYPDGTVKVVDLDELSEAVEKDLISRKLLTESLRNLNALLEAIYSGRIKKYQNILINAET